MHADDPIRYARHLALPQIGPAGQQRLAESRALITGLGGLGSAAALYLANAGIGTLILNDFDRVDLANLPRQILFTADNIEQYKATVTADRLRSYNPGVDIEALNQRLTAEELTAAVSNCDIVLDCTDNFASRSNLNRACFTGRTALISGAAIRFEGQLAVFRHDNGNNSGPCYQCLYSEQDDNFDDCAGQGVLAPVVGTVGCMMATEAIKLLAGIGSALEGKLWVYDALAGTMKTIGIRSRPDCPVCAPSA